MSRTSWDGALYLLGKDESKYADHQLEAVKNEDGTWAFTQTVAATEEGLEPTINYMIVPDGSANANIKETVAAWTVESAGEGFYTLTAGEGNNINAIGKKLHLNSGYQYVVISFLVS